MAGKRGIFVVDVLQIHINNIRICHDNLRIANKIFSLFVLINGDFPITARLCISITDSS